ncbi:isochorismatase family cysteine hydrolase [Streptomyces sp. NBC_01803]|uniref:isochorismatase family cysteine hydrolase n=1 Tax=Streptomyces sp. NBC_01803 TaxID=2975946 RepID=UPI002DD7EA15|nr:isochorismatase family cysteine hydrolase [Streptomyces sp. NBC_01803]WSA45122.1 cysteine hydrolase [Streptomyces sp. NBC_01803]
MPRIQAETAVLVVVDVQNGFVNEHSGHVVPAVVNLAREWIALRRPVVFTCYHNYPDSPYERFFSWTRLQGSPDTDLVPALAELAEAAHPVIDKTGYSFLNPQGEELVAKEGWTDLIFCGIATESCVLKSAADTFERGLAPWIVTDACASDAGPAVHDAGLLVARRLIGRGQLITTDALLTSDQENPR